MVEVWLFGRLVAALASAFAVVLVLIALTSVTYLSMTLAPVMRLPGSDRRSGRLGVSIAVGALLLAALGLRVGPPGSGGEIIPTLALAVAAAAALGSSSACAALGGGRALAALGAARRRRAAEMAGQQRREEQRLLEGRRAFVAGDDLSTQVADAESALGRLRAALTNLEAARRDIEARIAALPPATSAGDLARELSRAREEVAAKLDVGTKILRAAEVAVFHMASRTEVARLLRRRPRGVAEGLSAGEPGLPARLVAVGATLDAFLAHAAEARAALDALASRRPVDSARARPAGRVAKADLGEQDDSLAQACRDVDAVEAAYRAVRDRVEIVRVRIAARADIDAVASAAGEVGQRARASGLPAEDLQDLVDEVVRAESAIEMATPADVDPGALAAALGRGTAALGARNPGASLDELLEALKELS